MPGGASSPLYSPSPTSTKNFPNARVRSPLPCRRMFVISLRTLAVLYRYEVRKEAATFEARLDLGTTGNAWAGCNGKNKSDPHGRKDGHDVMGNVESPYDYGGLFGHINDGDYGWDGGWRVEEPDSGASASATTANLGSGPIAIQAQSVPKIGQHANLVAIAVVSSVVAATKSERKAREDEQVKGYFQILVLVHDVDFNHTSLTNYG